MAPAPLVIKVQPYPLTNLSATSPDKTLSIVDRGSYYEIESVVEDENITITISADGYQSQTIQTGWTSINVLLMPNQYFSKFSDGTNTYIVKDAEARSSLANKQDTLVSGTNIKTINNTSILGSGDITIDAEIDNETITKNGDNELQTVAIVNPNTNSGAISPLKIWNGTERQWINGEATVWNYWQTDVQAMWSNGGNLISSNNWDIAFGNNKFVIVGENTTETAYSTDGGATWTAGGNLPTGGNWYKISYGNNKFVVIGKYRKTAYSTDGGATWTAGGNLPTATSSWSHITYGNGIFVAISYGSASAAYSTDGGATWTGAELPSSSTWESLAYGDGNFVTISRDRKTAYSTDGGATWTAGGNLPTGDWVAVAYGDGKFISCKADGIGTQYSTDGGATWTAGGNLPTGTSCWFISYNDGKFITIMQNSNKSAYSTDGGATWNPTTMPSSERWMSMTYGNNEFVAITWENNKSAIFSVTYDKCYTLDSTPTTSSQVYSAPEITSTKTITSVGSGTITLSNNLVYNSTPTGNKNTYRTLGDAHPDWICNINNVGVKIGNTTIATDGSDLLPSQSGNNGKFLTTNGTAASWGTVDALPSQSGQSGKYLTTNGTTASWTSVTTPTVDQTYNASSSNAQSGTAVASAISSAISSVYKPAGSVVFANLPTPSASNEGNVYNVTNAFTTTSSFVEGAGINYPAGTNVVIINTGSNTYKFDTLTGAFQPLLVSGTNIKTINSNSILGSGNLDIDALPSQTNNSGKFLTTNGTTASWGNVTIPYGESTSAADAVQKEVTISEITELKTGQIIIVKPTITSTVASSTLKLNNFTAYPMLYGSSAISTSTDSIVWQANYPSWFRFNGSNWVFIGHGAETTYSAMSVAEGTTGTATTARSMRADRLKQIIQETTLTGLSTSTSSAVTEADTVTTGIGKLQAQINNKVDKTSIATTSTAGLVKPDGTSITIDSNGTISASAGAYAMVIVDYTEEDE